MEKGIQIHLLFILTFSLLVSSSSLSLQEDYRGIRSISVRPTTLIPNANFSVSVSLIDSTNISYMRVTYCRIYPEYICYYPSYLMENSSVSPNVFNTTISLKPDDLPGYTIGLRILVAYTDSTKYVFPEKNTPDFGFEVLEPKENLFYFAFRIDGALPSTATPTPLILPLTPIMLLIIMRKLLKPKNYNSS